VADFVETSRALKCVKPPHGGFVSDLGTTVARMTSEDAVSETLHVAAEAIAKAQPRGLSVGRMVQRPPILMPDRWAHAYVDDEDLTLCGVPVDGLHWEQFRALDFAAVNAYVKCRACMAAAGESSVSV
jgi:hypothetical protein